MHIADFSVGMLGANGIVGAGMPIATGAALAAKLEGGDGVAVAFFGDGASNEGGVPRLAEPGIHLEPAGHLRLRKQSLGLGQLGGGHAVGGGRPRCGP